MESFGRFQYCVLSGIRGLECSTGFDGTVFLGDAYVLSDILQAYMWLPD